MSKQTELYYWGNNEKGQLMKSKDTNYCSPRYYLSNIHLKTVSLGLDHSLFLSDSGELYTSVCPEAQLIPGLKGHKVVSISSGHYHCAALTSTGLIFAWGNGESGALGLGDTNNYSEPQRLSLNKCTQISCGARHTACISSGHLFTWGSGSTGQLGTGNTNTSLFPIKLSVEEPLEVSCGNQYTLILNKKGEVFGCGANNCGQLGTGNKKTSSVLIPINSDVKFNKVYCGSHSAGISQDSLLYLWGTGLFGEWLVPRLVNEAADVRHVNVGEGCGYAIDSYNSVWSWGVNGSGELGVGNFDQRTGISCVNILKNRGVRFITCSGGSTIAIGNDISLTKKSPKHNKENIHSPVKKPSKKIEKLKQKLETKENQIKSLQKTINQEEISKIQQENEYFKSAFKEMKKFKQQYQESLSQEIEKRKFAEEFVKELHSEHKMLIRTIEDLEKAMSELSKQCEIYQQKAAQTDGLIGKIKSLTEENNRLKGLGSVPDSISNRYTADVSYESITMASPDVSLVFDKKQKRDSSLSTHLNVPKVPNEFLKLAEPPEPIRSISPAYMLNKETLSIVSDPQTPPTFRDGNLANSGMFKNSLSEIRARLNLLQENKLELENKMSDFEKKLKEQL
jgi:alpha-tubulin suppressor-like RCC1 family protein